MCKIHIFVASSTKQIHLCRAIKEILEQGQDPPCVELWPEVMEEGENTLKCLMDAFDRCHVGIFILGSDDLLLDSKGSTAFVPRANVVFEFGLFMGRRGKDRAIALAPHDNPLYKMFSDYHGYTYIPYDEKSLGETEDTASNLREAIASVEKALVEATNEPERSKNHIATAKEILEREREASREAVGESCSKIKKKLAKPAILDQLRFERFFGARPGDTVAIVLPDQRAFKFRTTVHEDKRANNFDIHWEHKEDGAEIAHFGDIEAIRSLSAMLRGYQVHPEILRDGEKPGSGWPVIAIGLGNGWAIRAERASRFEVPGTKQRRHLFELDIVANQKADQPTTAEAETSSTSELDIGANQKPHMFRVRQKPYPPDPAPRSDNELDRYGLLVRTIRHDGKYTAPWFVVAGCTDEGTKQAGKFLADNWMQIVRLYGNRDLTSHRIAVALEFPEASGGDVEIEPENVDLIDWPSRESVPISASSSRGK
jgi:hypothetical protein